MKAFAMVLLVASNLAHAGGANAFAGSTAA